MLLFLFIHLDFDFVAQAKVEYEQLVQQQRVSRLKHLLDRSSLYTDFLYQRMQTQKVGKSKRAILVSGHCSLPELYYRLSLKSFTLAGGGSQAGGYSSQEASEETGQASRYN
jgi:hypothetical protein